MYIYIYIHTHTRTRNGMYTCTLLSNVINNHFLFLPRATISIREVGSSNSIVAAMYASWVVQSEDAQRRRKQKSPIKIWRMLAYVTVKICKVLHKCEENNTDLYTHETHTHTCTHVRKVNQDQFVEYSVQHLPRGWREIQTYWYSYTCIDEMTTNMPTHKLDRCCPVFCAHSATCWCFMPAGPRMCTNSNENTWHLAHLSHTPVWCPYSVLPSTIECHVLRHDMTKTGRSYVACYDSKFGLVAQ